MGEFSRSRASGAAPSARIELIDALRGMAMMGIIMVNFPSINTIPGMEATRYGFISSTFDAVMAKANMLFLNAKVYPIFAMLFGLGMAIFLQGAARKGGNALSLMLRRLGFLTLIGLLHICFVWWGDILLIYAGLGLAALPLYKKSNKTLGVLIALLLTATPLLHYGFYLFSPDLLEIPMRTIRLSPETDAAIHQVYQDGTFWEVTKQRVFNYVDYATPLFRSDVDDFMMIIGYFFQLFGLILFGMTIGRNGWHVTSKQQGHNVDLWFKRLGIAIGSVLLLQLAVPSIHDYLYYPIKSAIAFFYVLCFVKAYRYSSFQNFARLFVPVGKISMTVYLTHTTCASLLLYEYGLGYYGEIGPGLVIAASMAFGILITMAANMWVKKFRFGPFEWLWRGATYGTLPEMMIPHEEPEPIRRRA